MSHRSMEIAPGGEGTARELLDREAICRKIESILPEAGVCGLAYTVEYDADHGVWAVDLKGGDQHLRTFVEEYRRRPAWKRTGAARVACR